MDALDRDKLTNVLDILDKYEAMLADVETNLRLKGKSLIHANQEHPGWLSYYDERRIELVSLYKFISVKVDALRGNQWVQLTKNNARDLNTKDKDQYINASDAYIDMQQVLIEVDELKQKFESVVDAFKARGYALNNIVKVRTSAIEDSII